MSTKIPLHLGQQYSCEYLPERLARSAFVPLDYPLTTALYTQLIAQGFRRSGNLAYRPQCRTCSACIPVRLPCADFRPSRIQRRILRKNADLSISIQKPTWQPEHFDLYKRYLSQRHPDGGMADAAPEDYLGFLNSCWCDTRFHVIQLEGTCVAIAVVDHLKNALSAVYTFFDPALAGRSLGTFAVLWQIKLAQQSSLPWLYLGYWIQDCRKMSYKSRYQPLEIFTDGNWHRLETNQK